MIAQVAKYCTTLLTVTQCKELPFHNLRHTQEVVENVKTICTAMHVTKRKTELLVIAAWFHDTGFSKAYAGHEEESKKIAVSYLTDAGMDHASIEQICNCIEATRMPQNPTTELAEILCDADIFHISDSYFFYRKLLLRREWELFCNMHVTDKEWHVLNLEFLANFHFRSHYGKHFLEEGKEKNVKRVKQILTYYED